MHNCGAPPPVVIDAHKPATHEGLICGCIHQTSEPHRTANEQRVLLSLFYTPVLQGAPQLAREGEHEAAEAAVHVQADASPPRHLGCRLYVIHHAVRVPGSRHHHLFGGGEGRGRDSLMASLLLSACTMLPTSFCINLGLIETGQWLNTISKCEEGPAQESENPGWVL
jgi:hypothetical protein